MFIFLYDMQGMTMLSQPQVSCVINISWNSINDICTDIINVSVLIYINAFVLANMRRGTGKSDNYWMGRGWKGGGLIRTWLGEKYISGQHRIDLDDGLTD